MILCKIRKGKSRDKIVDELMYQNKKVQVTVLLWREEMFSGINPLAKTIVVYDAHFETLFRSTALEKFDTPEFLLPNASPSNVFSVRIV